MINVLHITECFGGVEVYLRMLDEYRDADKLDFSYILPDKNEFSKDLIQLGRRVDIVPMVHNPSLKNDLRSIIEIRKILVERKPDIVHLHSSKAGFLGRIAAFLLPVKVVYTPHAFYFLSKKGLGRIFFKFVEWFLMFFTTRLLATSPSEQIRAIDDVGYAEKKTSCITNSVEIKKIRLIAEEALTRRKEVVLVGRISYQKNQEMYLNVIKNIKNKLPDVVFTLIGVGFHEKDNEDLERICSASGVALSDLNIIKWISRDELLKYLSTVSIVVLTSRYESFGYVLAEAIALGVPVLGTKVDGICDIIKERENGWLFELNDVAGMANKIDLLLSDPQLWQLMSERSKKIAYDSFDIEKNSKKFTDFYESVISND